MKVDIDYQSNPLPNRPSSQDKHLWQKKPWLGFPSSTTVQFLAQSPLERPTRSLLRRTVCSVLPPTALDGKSDSVSQRSIRCRSLWRRSGQARLGPILRGKAKEYRLSGTFASSWCLGAINPSPSHVSLHRTEAKGSLFSVFGFISPEKTRYAFIQQEETVPCLPTFWTSAFYALLRTKKIMDGCFSYQNEAQS